MTCFGFLLEFGLLSQNCIQLHGTKRNSQSIYAESLFNLRHILPFRKYAHSKCQRNNTSVSLLSPAHIKQMKIGLQPQLCTWQLEKPQHQSWRVCLTNDIDFHLELCHSSFSFFSLRAPLAFHGHKCRRGNFEVQCAFHLACYSQTQSTCGPNMQLTAPTQTCCSPSSLVLPKRTSLQSLSLSSL